MPPFKDEHYSIGKLSQIPIVTWKANWIFLLKKEKLSLVIFFNSLVWKEILLIEIEENYISCQRSNTFLVYQGI